MSRNKNKKTVVKKRRKLKPLEERQRDLRDRFASKIVTGADGCAVWIGATQNKDRETGGQRGCMYDPTTGRVVAATAIAWRLQHGTQIPRGQRAVGKHQVTIKVKHDPTGEMLEVTGPCIRHLELTESRSTLSGEAHPRATLDNATAASLQESYRPRSKRMSLAKLVVKYKRLNVSREAIRQIARGFSDGGQKVPKKYVERIREEYEPPRTLGEFVSNGKRPAKSTLASAATGRTWRGARAALKAEGEDDNDASPRRAKKSA